MGGTKRENMIYQFIRELIKLIRIHCCSLCVVIKSTHKFKRNQFFLSLEILHFFGVFNAKWCNNKGVKRRDVCVCGVSSPGVPPIYRVV
jgi:hypothetical protein